MNNNSEQNEIVIEVESVYKEESGQEDKVETKEAVKKSFSNAVHESGLVAAKTVAGVGIGAAMGIGAVVAISVAEVVIPTLMVVKIFSFAGGALGFLKGINKK
jgi:hypothetical protein